MEEKRYELNEVLEAFGEGFARGFGEAKYRNIITQSYYTEKYESAITEFKKKLSE